MKNQKHNPKISIITITYNSAKTVEETIKSVVSQDYPNLEYLIIDGGSKDNTLEIVERYRDKISLVISEPDKGISDAFNKGIKYATGEIIGIINSDDLLMPGALEKISESYEPGVGVYRGNLIIWNDEKNSRVVSTPGMNFSLYSFKSSPICHPSTFVTKETYEKYGGYKLEFKYIMDEDLLIRLYERNVRFKKVDSELAVFRIGGVTTNPFWKKLREVKLLYTGNGANIMWAYLRVSVYVLRSILLMLAKKVISDDTLKKWKYTKK